LDKVEKRRKRKNDGLDHLYDAIQLLSLPQQATPGMERPVLGNGTEQEPWILRTPCEWWYAARQLSKGGDGRFWFKIGGRSISVNKSDKYAADHGPATGVGQRFSDDHGPTYPAIYSKLAADLGGLATAWQNSEVARQVRALLQGHQTLKIANSIGVPVLTAAFFLSECSRNFTAFHTGLMILDLIEKGIKTGIAPCRWENVLWHPAVLNAQTELDKDVVRDSADRKHVRELVKDFESDKSAFDKLVSRDARGGLHPMAHQGSVRQSKQFLYGKLKETLTMVRQVEATVLIRWLAALINDLGLYEAAPVSETLSDQVDNQFDKMLVLQAAIARSTQEVDFSKLGSAVKKKKEKLDKLLDENDLPLEVVLPYFHDRAGTFDCML
jgi:hypothetical protein